jgi:hypothetical protein
MAMLKSFMLSVALALTPSLASANNLVFVTSGTYDGNLGGLTGADYICNTLAGAAGLGGTFVAWLSDSTADARDRLTGAGPFVTLQGHTVATDVADLTDGLIGSISRDEYNDPPDISGVWTGTNPDGTWYGLDCLGWTSNVNGGSVLGRRGNKATTSTSWTSFSNNVCFSKRHLYCFQQ